MKLPIAILVVGAGLAIARADQPSLSQIPGDQTLAKRVEFIERYLQMERMDWQLVLPEDYSAVVTFCQQGGEAPILELSLEPGSTTPLYFVSAPDGAERMQFFFGGPDRSASVYRPKLDNQRKITFGQLNGMEDMNLFEVFLSEEATTPQVWCEIRFHKK